MISSYIDNANDWVRLSTKIHPGPRLSSLLSSVLKNQLLKRRKSTNERLIRARLLRVAYLVIGANGNVRGKKVTSLARWPPNPSRCWALTWRTIGPMEDYWARSGGLLAEWPLSTSGGVFPLTRLTTDA